MKKKLKIIINLSSLKWPSSCICIWRQKYVSIQQIFNFQSEASRVKQFDVENENGIIPHLNRLNFEQFLVKNVNNLIF